MAYQAADIDISRLGSGTRPDKEMNSELGSMRIPTDGDGGVPVPKIVGSKRKNGRKRVTEVSAEELNGSDLRPMRMGETYNRNRKE